MKLLATAQGIQIVRFDADHHEVNPFLGECGEVKAFVFEKSMTGVFQVIQIHRVIDDAFDVTFIIPHFHFDLECFTHGLACLVKFVSTFIACVASCTGTKIWS